MQRARDFQQQWLSPSSIYRSAPFWSWNSKLDPDRLCRAIESMHEAGMGGFFMHSRYGLKTPYLSEEWFQCVSACIDKARELDMKAYLYDEDRWPSGAAGGLVTRDNPEYRIHYLLCADSDEPDVNCEPLSHFALEMDEGRLVSYEAIDAIDAPKPAGTIARAFVVHIGRDDGWHNDGAYLDTMNPEAVQEFIHVTHQAYADRYGKNFGDLIPAIFTDEPNYGVMWSQWGSGGSSVGIQWTPQLPREFKKRRGYDLRDHLPELFYPLAGQEFSKVRMDYRRTVTELFVESFSEQVGRWCEKHRIALTGHMLEEPTLKSQIRAVGSCMPHYEFMQWPGIDILTDQDHELATAKQCSSVMDQLGKERSLSELYGCTGWDWPMEGHKFVGDWHAAVGINFRCPHLTHYSLAGGAKRDYPASIFNHSPWWRYYQAVENYFGRLNYMLTQGTPIRDVLVIHPIETAWGTFEAIGNQGTESWQRDLDVVMKTLTGRHFDWDFGDESLLARHGAAAKGKFKVGRMSYRLVVIPSTMTLRQSTVNLLQKFLKSGGRVLLCGSRPTMIDGTVTDGLDEVLGECRSCDAETEALAEAVEEQLEGRRLNIVDESDAPADTVWSMLRKVPGGHLLFIQSHDRKQGRRLHVRVRANKPVILWEALTGTRRRVKSKVDGKFIEFDINLPPTGSALLSAGLSMKDALPAEHEHKTTGRSEIGGPFRIRRSEPNTLPLDYCRYRVAGDDWSEQVPTLQADGNIRRRYDLGTRFGREHQPWYLYATGVVDTAPRDKVRMQWTFHVTDTPESCQLAVENPDDYEITVNGKPVAEPDGFWVDEDIRTIDISDLIRTGDNEVQWAFRYRPDMELEDMYLVGDFAVQRLDESQPYQPGNVTIVSPVSKMDLGGWIAQGLPFYGAGVRYSAPVTKPAGSKRLRLSLPGVDCTMAVVHVNGTEFVLPWQPFSADITDALTDGANDIEIEVIGGRKNILGPLHRPWEAWTGPGHFNPEAPEWTFEYQLNDHGLMQPIVLETVE